MSMNPVRTHSRGFTLVELLVVMAIIAIIIGISIPLLARTSFLSGSALQNASRELYAYMRAAKIYAVDHNIDTAIVYGLKEFPGPTLEGEPNPMVVADGFLLARALTPKEKRLLRSQGVTNTDNIFVRIGDAEGQYHTMTDGTCILNINQAAVNPSLTKITVRDTDLETTIAPTYVLDPNAPVFPGHIFTASGIMTTPSTSTARVELMVAPLPTADPQDRTNPGPNGEPGYVAAGQPDYRYIGVEIKPSMGRVKIASDT